MADAFSWSCPYCNRQTTITDTHLSTSRHLFNHYNKDGDLCVLSQIIVCPNPACREYEVTAALFHTKLVQPYNAPSYTSLEGKPLARWTLKPKSGARPFPAYIPKAILDDYNEACLIVSDSPKASATLSRRCLQGMIRDFWGIIEKTLSLEIKGLQGRIDKATWEAIDAIRSVGNIGAHMENDINLIVDVEPAEAAQLIGLIEFLLKDWYVGRHEREEHKKNVIALAAAKAAAKAGTSSTP